ncbi:hypothetical protein [Francisella sp. LA112445]|uniref:hypothetical protein n=1 Tax=Francisella sp. LA112445 TaxID=1395624 RepID=UPI001788BD0E|nr:hypothetical protein [Francisella sp. LA112445]QIW10490.1 hypothetical protein FIP56_07180 [Francisella sp. LA112445]
MRNKYLSLVVLGLMSFPLLSQAYQQTVYTSNSTASTSSEQCQTCQTADDIQAEEAKAKLNKFDDEVHGQDTNNVAQAANGMS